MGVSGNHTGSPIVSTSMAPPCTKSGSVTGSLPQRRRIISGCLLVLSLSLAQALGAEDRIILAVDDSQRATLPNNVTPRIQSGTDLGPVDPSLDLPYVTLVLQPSSSQQADLDQLLAQQQDPSSPNYHRWLTPEQYADRFGLSQSDIDKIVSWLGQHGLTLKSVARSRNAIAFGGAASQIGSAFGVRIHSYNVGGEQHYANSTDPTIPVAFQGVVLIIRGLHDFRLKPRLRPSAHPRDNLQGAEQLAPDDIATIYNIAPLYDAGIDGAGQKLAIVGQTDIIPADIQQYRSYFNLPVNNPITILVDNQDPGIQANSGDLGESELDLEFAGAVARNATIYFVTSTNVEDSLSYAINDDVAPIVSTSYGDCELDTGSAGAQALQQLGMQANAQGQTIFAASGDAGALDCYGDGGAINNALSVDMPASLPQVTGVGGTQFSEGSGTYWSSTNTSNQASALFYIPEIAWNEGFNPQPPAGPEATGGGESVFFTKPSWQTGSGVPNDGARDVPDVSISASPDHDGYLMVSQGSLQIIGGTSVGGPQFAGIAALLSQYLVKNGFQSSQSLGNINPQLYQLASVAGVFHDITIGSNSVPDCQGCAAITGYSAGPGYDRVTGLGTPNVYNLVAAWHGGSVSSKGSVTMALAASAASVTFSETTVLTATVTSASGAEPTGTVTFSTGSYALGTAALNANGVATLTLSGVQLPVGPNSITAQYNGDTNYFGAAATASVTETSPTTGPPSVGGVSNAASYTQTFAPGGIVSVFGTQLAPATGVAGTVPLPTILAGAWATVNGIAAPLYFVSATQMNIQIPYEVPVNSTATLRIENGASAFFPFNVAATAPAIFTTNQQGTGQGAILNTSYQLVDASHPVTPGPNTYIQIYCMGLGAVTNQPADGAAALSSPLSETSTLPQVTIGGIAETATFSGLAPGFVGLYQVNAQVPAGVTAGSAVPVSISIGGVASNTVTIAVAQ